MRIPTAFTLFNAVITALNINVRVSTFLPASSAVLTLSYTLQLVCSVLWSERLNTGSLFKWAPIVCHFPLFLRRACGRVVSGNLWFSDKIMILYYINLRLRMWNGVSSNCVCADVVFRKFYQQRQNVLLYWTVLTRKVWGV
jgi:hypothetical protein